jgi:hypothetical protein
MNRLPPFTGTTVSLPCPAARVGAGKYSSKKCELPALYLKEELVLLISEIRPRNLKNGFSDFLEGCRHAFRAACRAIF